MVRFRSRTKIWALAVGGIAMALAFSGCQNIRFYGQAATGEYQILAHQTPIQTLIADTNTPPALREKFKDILKIRDFAAQELKLPVTDSYLKYVDLHRPFVVWNVNVAPALSLDPKTWWFPVVGRASYRGYFSEKGAQDYARQWEAKGWDVYVAGIETYSTLGWFRDPLLNTFIGEPVGDLAEIIFHELGHQRLFISGDTDFNEAFATTVALEGVRRWFAAAHQPQDYERYRRALEHDNQFVQLVMAARQNLAADYADPHLDDAAKLRRKANIIEELRHNYAKLKASWGGSNEYDGWFSHPINNAKLNTIAAYYDLVPAFQALLRENGGDMERFYNATAAIGKLPFAQRHQELNKLMGKQNGG
ncbi:MAG TPA: aminopeptidase [Verrucomicrobiae bacterium]|jgi:predicted aminopeptidase|nr:aminopeptidase [Verrucomicrobiae bacterium]